MQSWMYKTLFGVFTGLVFFSGVGLGPSLHNKVREAQFTPIGKAEGNAARLIIASSKGVCKGDALEARHEPKNGPGEALMGCWIAVGPYIQVSFPDGEVGQVPMSAFLPVDKP